MKNKNSRLLVRVVAALLSVPAVAFADSETGLKPGDRTPLFPVSAVTGPFAGKTLSYVSALQGAPTLIVFVAAVEPSDVALLRKVNETWRRFESAGVKAFAVCLAGQSVAPTLRSLSEKDTWSLPLTVTRGGPDDPVCKQCKLNEKARNTVLVTSQNQLVYARQDLSADDFKAVAEALQKLADKK